MKTYVLSLFVLVSLRLVAASVGDSYEQVLAEKGQPVSRMSAGSVIVMNYPDVTVRFKNNVVVEIRALKDANVYVTHGGGKAAPASAVAADAPISDSAWATDYRDALNRASTGHKHVFLLFTGSDWCIWCKRLEGEILSTPQFAQYASDKLELVKLDYPQHTPQSDDLKQQNRSLASQYGIKGYPTVIILNSDGKVVGELGYQAGGPDGFIDKLRALE